MPNILRELFYGLLVLLAVLSLVGQLFVYGYASVLGACAFVLFFFSTVFRPNRHRDAPRPSWPASIGLISLLAGLVLFLTAAFGEKGGPLSLGELPAFAARDHYMRGHTEVSRAQFLTEAISFSLAWHGMLVFVVLDRWLAGRHGNRTHD